LAAEAAVDVEAAIERLKAWGVAVPANSRLHEARKVLLDAAQTGAIIPAHLGTDIGIHALQVANDYKDISAALPPDRVASVRKELSRSLAGPLDPNPSDRSVLQAQSQYLVTAALWKAGAELEYPRHSPQTGLSSPDVLVTKGISQYAVEVKRPQQRKNVIPRLEDGAAQLADYGLMGAIIVDVSDCVAAVPHDAFDGAVRDIALDIYARVWRDGIGFTSGFSKVMLAGAIGRRAWQVEAGTKKAMIDVHSCSSICRFATTQNSLLDHRAGWLRKLIQDGQDRMGFTAAEQTS
jgi:hypothetical protein